MTVNHKGTLTLVPLNNGDLNYADDGPLELRVGDVTIAPDGIIRSDALGYGGSTTNGFGPGGGLGTDGGYTRGGGGGHGGHGGNGNGSYLGGSAYGSAYAPTALGSGGGGGYVGTSGALAGGNGGGAMHLIIDGTLTVDGRISANGSNGTGGNIGSGYGGSGGGAGGSIWIEAQTLGGAGTIQANGGATINGGGGSGGRIAISHTGGSTSSLTIQAYGGPSANGFEAGGAGTVYLAPTDHLIVDNNNAFNGQAAGLTEDAYTFATITLQRNGHLDVLGAGSAITLTSSNVDGDGTAVLTVYGAFNVPAVFTISGLTLDVRGTLAGDSDLRVGNNSGAVGGLTLRASTPQHVFNTLTIGATGRLTLVPLNDGDTLYTDDAPYELRAGTMTVNAGGLVTSNGLGYVGGDRDTYPDGLGPGGGHVGAAGYIRGGGAGYGGRGGDGDGIGWGGTTYGSMAQPTELGSGGASGNIAVEKYAGGVGGGAMHIMITGTLTLNGIMSADGANGAGGHIQYAYGGSGGGSGGSIWITAGTLAGAGKISAAGGASVGGPEVYGGGGAGGRIAFDVQTFTFTGRVLVNGGRGYHFGGRGTIWGMPPRYAAFGAAPVWARPRNAVAANRGLRRHAGDRSTP